MQRAEMLYQGKSKKVFATDDPARVILEFTDEATAFNAKKRATVGGKGQVNCAISRLLFDRVEADGVATHLIEPLSDTELVCAHVEIVPVEVVVRSRIAGSFAKRYGIDEGTPLETPLLEWFYKSDALDDPLLGSDVAVALGWAKRWELQFMREAALTVHASLAAFWHELGIELIDAKYEFGRSDGRLLLADELSPDGCRLWEHGTGRKLDKDVFRRDLADLGETYQELHHRVFSA